MKVNHGTNNGIKVQQVDFDATFNDCFQLLDLATIILLNHQHLPLGETTLQGAILTMKMYSF